MTLGSGVGVKSAFAVGGALSACPPLTENPLAR